jgi:hypothetical protein
MSQWASTFFGLTNEYVANIFEKIFDLVRLGFSFMDVYLMPVHIRNFYFRLAARRMEMEEDEYKKIKGNSQSTPSKKSTQSVKVPGFVPTKSTSKIN